ncbi:hypothetical protein [Bdellovibrio sp. HCB209]|uniref:hypothetical protein n=1 Tax=Bdellovibrio sp. HCB209 TaxID=3394354 RepID=UPI0039B3D0B5
MCKTTLILMIAFASIAWATPKTKLDLLSDLKNRREKAANLDYKGTSEELQKAGSVVKSAVDHYKKLANPVLTAPEEQVLFVSYSMEPVLKLAKATKPSAQDCEKAKKQINLEDKGTKPEDSTASDEAQEALSWLALLCK